MDRSRSDDYCTRPVRLTVCQTTQNERTSSHENVCQSSILFIFIRWLAIGVVGLAFLSCLVASKLSALVVGAYIRLHRNLSSTLHLPPNSDNVVESANDDVMSSKYNDLQAAFWWLVMMLVLPYVYSLARSLWLGGFRADRPWPRRSALLWGIGASVLESIGLTVFALGVLTVSPSSTTVWTMNGVFAVPILLHLVTMVRGHPTGWAGRRRTFIIILISALVIELVGIVCACIVEWRQLEENDSTLDEVWPIPVSLFLLSIAWSPHVQKQQLYPRQAELERLYEKFRQNRPSDETSAPDRLDPSDVIFAHPELSARWKISIITSALKLILVFGLCLLYVYIDSVHTHTRSLIDFTDFRSSFAGLNPQHPLFACFMVNVFCSIGGCILGFLACTMCMQIPAFALPLSVATPISVVLVLSSALCNVPWIGSRNCFRVPNERWMFTIEILGALFLLLGQILSTMFFIFKTQTIVMQKASQLFWLPGYNGIFLEQNLLLGRKSVQTYWQQAELIKRAQKSHVIICTTMYREAKREMEQLMESIREINKAKQVNDRNFESHIFFDNGVRGTKLTEFALQLLCVVKSTFEVTSDQCTKVVTPYGLRLTWQLPSVVDGSRGMCLVIHFKDNQKVKSKKRWSQVMYMSYVVDYFILEEITATYDNTFILTTDADVKFKPESVEALLDLMLRDNKVGAVCARTFPMGSGPVYWYQIFDYAIGHWLQKAANHVLGSVLCCPGCFSVYRVQALRDVLATYGSQVEEASDFLTKDMGEDRWLCTLLVQAGWRLEYCAAADNSTYCPEEFEEFFKQRRRWIPSTLANQVVLLREWTKLSHHNKQISFLFIVYQGFLLFSTLINPSLSIVIMVGGLYYAWEVSQMTSTVLLILVTVGFTVVCIYCAPDTQLMVAKVLTIFSAMIMAAVVVGTIVQIVDESTPHVLPETSTFLPIPTTTRNSSITTPSTHQEIVWNSLPSSTPPSPTTTIPSHVHLPISITNMYLAFLTGMFIVTAIMHLPEAFCLFHGIWYLLCLPAGNLIMMIYSICNLTDRSWGTREEKQSNFSTSGSQLDVIVEFLKKIFFCCDKSSTTVAAAVTESRTSDDSQVDLAGDDIDQVDGPTNNRSQQHPTRRTSGSFSKHRTDDSSRFQFANINAFSQPIPVSDWLPQNLRDQYGSTLEMNGYDDTSYLFGMTDSELRDVGITSKAHRSAIHEAIKFLPEPEIEPCVPKNVTHWLENVGLSMYATNFCKAHIVNATTMETLKGMKRKDLKSELGITKPGHQKRLLLAISKLRHATTMERAQMETKHEIDALKTHNLKTVRPEEYDFWECLRQQRLLPESTVFAHDLELKEKLIELRNSTLLVFAITNVIWLILISTLVTKAQLNVLDTNALGLAFLIVFGLILCIQFICMLLHRCSTWMHLIARTPTKCGDPVRASWAFRDLTTADQLNLMANADLTNNTEDAEARRARDEINDQLRRAYQDRVTQRLISVDASLSERISERQPLLGSQGRTSSAGYSSLGRPVGNTSSTVSAHQRTVHFNAECV